MPELVEIMGTVKEFNVGDIVRLKTIEEYANEYGVHTSERSPFGQCAGNVGTVVRVFSGYQWVYSYEVKFDPLTWTSRNLDARITYDRTCWRGRFLTRASLIPEITTTEFEQILVG